MVNTRQCNWKPEEISRSIIAQIKHYENVIEQSEVSTGRVIMVGSGIAQARRPGKVHSQVFSWFVMANTVAQNLEENTVSITVLLKPMSASKRPCQRLQQSRFRAHGRQ